MVNLRQLDCTTYTETVMALTLCMKQKQPSFDNFCRNLRLLRYKDGVVSYANRLHYFTSWIEENTKKGLVDCIEEPSAAFSATQTVNANYMTTHTRLYPMLVKNPEWISLIRDTEKEISGRKHKYIPKSRLNESALLRQAIHDGDIIVILTSKQGLDTSHIGIACGTPMACTCSTPHRSGKKWSKSPRPFSNTCASMPRTPYQGGATALNLPAHHPCGMLATPSSSRHGSIQPTPCHPNDTSITPNDTSYHPKRRTLSPQTTRASKPSRNG